MSQGEYEDQPEHPDLGDVVQEPTGETLVGPPDTDVLDAGYVAPDRPYVTDDPATLARSQDLESRLREERPDVSADESEPATEDTEPDRAPRLAGARVTPDTRSAEDLEATGVGIDGGAASTEEAALHLRDEDDTARHPLDEGIPQRAEDAPPLDEQAALGRPDPDGPEDTGQG